MHNTGQTGWVEITPPNVPVLAGHVQVGSTHTHTQHRQVVHTRYSLVVWVNFLEFTGPTKKMSEPPDLDHIHEVSTCTCITYSSPGWSF